MQPDSAELWACRAALDLYRGNAESALPKLDKAEALNAALSYIFSTRAIAYAMLDKFAEARIALRQAIVTGYEKPDYILSRIEAFESLSGRNANLTN